MRFAEWYGAASPDVGMKLQAVQIAEGIKYLEAELGIEKVHLLIRPRGRRSPEDRFTKCTHSRVFSLLEPGWKKFCDPVAGDEQPDGDRCGSIRPSDSKKRILEIVTSGKSWRSCARTSPILTVC